MRLLETLGRQERDLPVWSGALLRLPVSIDALTFSKNFSSFKGLSQFRGDFIEAFNRTDERETSGRQYD